MNAFEINNAIDTTAKSTIDKYVIYLRKSRADIEAEKLGEGETLKRHKEILTNLCAKKGLYVENIYEEIVSGETIAARPEIQKMIQECYDGKYRGIVVIDVDRLSRGNQGDMQTIMDCLKFSNDNNGLLVVTPTKTYDVTHNMDDEEYMEFVLFMSRREYKTIQKRLERGRRQAVVEGNFMGSYRPYGYNIIKTKTGRTLAPNPDESPIVRKIYEWTINENLTPGKICKRLDAMGVPTYSGAPEWNIATIKTILTNPTYIGKVKWNDRMTVKKMIDNKIVKSRPRSSHTDHYMEYDGKHPALVSEEMFQAASKRFYSDRTKGNLKLQNPLASILVCANCKTAMQYMQYKNRPETAPRFNHRPSKVCKVKSAVADDVMNAVIHGMKLYLDEFQMKIDNVSDTDEQSVNEQLDTLNAEMRKTERKLSKLFDAWENDDISDNEFVERKKVNNDKIESIKNQIHELEKTMPQKEEYVEKVVKLSDALDALLNPTLDADIKNAYLKKIVDRIEFSRENGDEFILDIYLQ